MSLEIVVIHRMANNMLVFISLSANTPGKDMNPTNLPSAFIHLCVNSRADWAL